MGENICKLNIQNGVNIQNVQRTHTTQPKKKKTQTTGFKNGQKMFIRIFPEKAYR